MRSLIQQRGAIAVIGPTLSQVAIAVDPIANDLHTPVLGVSNSSEGIVGSCARPCPWSWRDSLGLETAVPANVTSYIDRAAPDTAALLYARNDLVAGEEAQLPHRLCVQMVCAFSCRSRRRGAEPRSRL